MFVFLQDVRRTKNILTQIRVDGGGCCIIWRNVGGLDLRGIGGGDERGADVRPILETQPPGVANRIGCV